MDNSALFNFFESDYIWIFYALLYGAGLVITIVAIQKNKKKKKQKKDDDLDEILK
ncbi:MAG: hypothetical protein IPH66_14250 [Crocinitomicaceae bacterium]|nr:hypothetical protein [Crocinitomicaceae bacterium]